MSIEQFYADNNLLTGSLPEYKKWKAIVSLAVQNNRLSGPLPVSYNLSWHILQDINLANNTFSGPLPPEWGEFDLDTLDVANNQLTGPIPSLWKKWKNITTFDVSNNMLEGNLPEQFGSTWKKVRTIDLQNNSFTGVLPAWEGMGKLEKLHVFSNELTGNLPSSYSHLHKLRSLDLGNNKLHGPLPSTWGGMNLTDVNLSNNSLTGPFPTTWKNMRMLQELDISDNDFSESLVLDNFPMDELVMLRIDGNDFYGSIKLTTPSPKLRSLNVTSNDFVEPLEEDAFDKRVGTLVLDVRDNHIICPYPDFPTSGVRYRLPSSANLAKCLGRYFSCSGAACWR